jgi:hypothetical protein
MGLVPIGWGNATLFRIYSSIILHIIIKLDVQVFVNLPNFFVGKKL